jgi:hypothetical protein
MKSRAGFVSNSSSSSFIVHRTDDVFGPDPQPCLSDAQEAVLKKLGFRPTWIGYPNQIEVLGFNFQVDEEGAFYAHHHIINHDEIFTPLIKAKIPFRAVCHYGHWSVFWDGKSDTILYVKNVGNALRAVASVEANIKEALEEAKEVIYTEPITEYV